LRCSQAYNLINKNNKECLTILDKDGYVIATSDKEHINFGVQLPIILNDSYKIISFNGRDYIAKTSQTSGYQGFYGPKWYGHIMIPLEYAFLSISQNALAIDEKGQRRESTYFWYGLWYVKKS
jgi:hypothetical protein